jgi:hypothetical protein
MAQTRKTRVARGLATHPAGPVDSTEIAVGTLSGADAVDKHLLDEAVAELNAIATAKGLEASRALAECVLRTFFGGKLDAFRPNEKKHLSWRALAKRKGLRVGHSNLSSSVRVLDQLRLLPDNIGAALPVSHHRRLLVVKDADAKLRLAEKAVGEKLSVKDLEAEVKHQRAKEPEERRGRKRLPDWVKAVHALESIKLDAGEDVVAEVVKLPEGEVQGLLATIDRQIESLQSLKAKIGPLVA